MIATKIILLALAVCIKASPAKPVQATTVTTAPTTATTDWLPLPFPSADVNWDDIEIEGFNNPDNWNLSAPFPSEVTSPAPGKNSLGGIGIMSGPCNQGTCPDYFASFDLLYTLYSYPNNVYGAFSEIRVNDCNVCLRGTVASSYASGSILGGCYNFRTCNRDQEICVDPGKGRAHRRWKDNNHKTCYNMQYTNEGSCGVVAARAIIRPSGTTLGNGREDIL
ncbi:hypothetical protein QBC38DRAFT_460449 [Podospora fimiseda]|uniref:Uncharacterized protein n=1 Tax=Podospora fimiseda TaxID=252190 RepID=A0AAN7BFL9_9PEZI|nr:hypothetical protein QBC38DRAFT_460449 [Podospora fimiseda]